MGTFCHSASTLHYQEVEVGIIRLLRDFDDNLKLFTQHPSEDLRKEMLRLDRLNEITKEKFEVQLDLTGAD